ncbi:MAG TPA: transposase [Gammaproteobacteria bacterium]|nr:transposase [Gammaproteobacteria bacterium]
MQSPLTDADTLFEELLQDLPPETVPLAREFKAFGRAKKVKTPEHLLRLVLLYCGLDKSLREAAGTFTVLYESITDQSVAERLQAWGPWVNALLRQMLPMSAVSARPEGLRFVVIDASSVQAPGAKGIDHRLHLAMDLVSLQFIEVLISDVHTGETLKHFPLGPGDVALTDRGYAQAQGMSEAVKRGASLIVRLNPFSVVLFDAIGEPLRLSDALKRQRTETIRTLEVVIESADGQDKVRGWVQAYRLNAEQAGRARQQCRKRHKTGTPKAETLDLAGWVLVFTTLAPAVLSAQTIMALYRLRWQVELAIKRWKSVLDVDALRAKAGSPLAEVWLHGKLLYAMLLERRMRRKLGDSWGRLDQTRRVTWWRVWGLLKDEIAPMVTGALFWKEEAWTACLNVLAERPRRRTLQQLPPEAVAVLYHSDEPQPESQPIAA